MRSQTSRLIHRSWAIRRLLAAACLATAAGPVASAQCYLFSSNKSNASLKIQINSIISTVGPVITPASRSYAYSFLGDYTLTVGKTVQVSTNNLGSVAMGHTTVGGIDLTTVSFGVAQPSLKAGWEVNVQGSGDLLPKGLPQMFPPISEWNGPALDAIALGGNVFYIIDQITNCTASTGGGAPTITISNSNLQFAYTEGGTVPAPQIVTISDAAGAPLSFVATNIVSWISLSQTATTLTISVDTTGLSPHTFDAAIVITVPGATNNPQAIKVTLTVTGNAPPTISSPMQFTPVTPCRVVNTENPAGPLGGPPLAAQSARSFVIPESSCGIPSTAGAYSLNVAVVPKKTLGYITVWPSGQAQPPVATLTSLDGRIRSNAAIVPAGTGGAISVFATDDTDVIIDINGYFNVAGTTATTAAVGVHGAVKAAATAGASAFYPITPCRIADTRNAAGLFGGPSLPAGSTRSFPIPQGVCPVPSDAQAYALNFAAVPKGPLGYLTAWPTGQSQPVVASLNDVTGTVAANAVIVPAGTNGAVDVFTTNETDLIIDINGYFAPAGAGGLSLYAMTPCRVLDSRNPQGTPPFSSDLSVNVTASPCGVPATAQAFVFNATVVPPGPFGFLTMWPEGEPQPPTATLNALDGAITSNMAIVPTKNGSITAFASNPTYLILDIFGFYAP